MTGGRRRVDRHRAQAILLAMALVVGGSVLSACTAVRNDLGTAQSQCYVAIPAATAAIHAQKHLKGVALVGLGSLRNLDHQLYRAAVETSGRPSASVCLVAFTGHFQADQVTAPVGQPSGRLAVVALRYPDNRVLATLLVPHPPFAFGHSHIGLL
ncbi:MAG TPA: hypothetical protein VMB82_05980 [Acidimicrobiales bacterium]|nr:hypothetical protein [Acidimicrobiales bacterium]